MNENLNLVEILKDCPKGTKLYSTVYGDVEFYKIDLDSDSTLKIYVKIWAGVIVRFDDSGKLELSCRGECTLFPSRTQRNWAELKPKKEGLVPPCEFKDGDILSYQCGHLKNRTIYIYRYHERFNTAYYVALSGDVNETFRIDNEGGWSLNGYNDTARFATEEEKQKLFDAIKLNGYKWNAETKTLGKLVESKFDPKTLKPFDKVLVRDYSSVCWVAQLFSHIIEGGTGYPYLCIDDRYKYCIPYNDDTKHLVGTTEEAPEFYRYWED